MSGKTEGGSLIVLLVILIFAVACVIAGLPFLQTAALRMAGG